MIEILLYLVLGLGLLLILWIIYCYVKIIWENVQLLKTVGHHSNIKDLPSLEEITKTIRDLKQKTKTEDNEIKGYV